ncbi:MAG: hypothetical protein D6683_12115 [Actinomyces sp.]|nr:MAG: hypothetical protein D6683_12115 [Actinomyces sp.]
MTADGEAVTPATSSPPPASGTLVPPRRLGRALRTRRENAGASLAAIAARSGRLGVGDLADIEAGRRTVDDELATHLLEIYGVTGADLLPSRTRLVIDLDEGLIRIYDATAPVPPAGVGPVATLSDPDETLARYLALVWRLRGVEPGTEIALRSLDVQVLADALAASPAEIERRLHALAGTDRSLRTSRRLRRRLLLPAVGVVVAATAAGVLLLVADDPSPSPTPPPTIADAVVVEAPAPSLAVADAAVVDADTPGVPASSTDGPPSVSIGDPVVEENPGAGG